MQQGVKQGSMLLLWYYNWFENTPLCGKFLSQHNKQCLQWTAEKQLF